MASQDLQTQPFHWHYTELNDRDFQIRGRTAFFVIVLFAVVLLFSLLFLYARWVCRYHTHHIPFSATHPSSTPTTLAPTPGGLSPARIRALPITLYKPSSTTSPAPNSSYRGNGGDCCICLGGFEEGEKVKVLPKCGHCFHSECVDRWLVASSSCPICRASLLDDSLILVVAPVVTDQ